MLDLAKSRDAWLGKGRFEHPAWERSRSWALHRCTCKGRHRCRVEGRANYGNIHVVDVALRCGSGLAAVISAFVEGFAFGDGVEPPTAVVSLGKHPLNSIEVVLGKAQQRVEGKHWHPRQDSGSAVALGALWHRGASWFEQRAYEE
ncbi:hypothetical protein GCM10022415_13720 [Knoellia locipacati]|uniref:Uncharacterized protein n=1 Tax=Knoellia locipacati TaxID=882824 RepID=A0A512SZH8_9MICO|nr:hypothetical protein KLO01_13700 [Knoellia locipacati]